MTDTVYAIVNYKTRQAYVGRTLPHRLQTRWSEHLLDAANPLYVKDLAEALRHDPTGFEFEHCETSETASEREWFDAFKADGFTMLNKGATNRVAPKRVDRSANELWREPKRVVYKPRYWPAPADRPEPEGLEGRLRLIQAGQLG